ncbi:MAG TPA: glutamate--cysteine ligase [Rickettsiales bacterium]|nr:glutamate--cysteine ligase [Rickettsiales bacterium]
MSKIIDILVNKINEKSNEIEAWFDAQFSQNKPLLYNSIDLRHCGFKIAPIDTNCFPAGFNNLISDSKIRAQKLMTDFLRQNFANAKNILIIPESHTKNLKYLENVLALQEILQNSQNEVVIGSLLVENMKIALENGKEIKLTPIQKNGDKIATIDGFVADLVILNNDLTNGIPEILQNVATPIVPSTDLGWYQRKKSQHFTIYNKLAQEISQILQIDSWLISSMHHWCGEVNFKAQIGIECLAKYVDELIIDLQKKYDEYGVKDQPYCYVKADSGTYGIAVMTAFSGQDILEINKKERNKMSMLKGSTLNTMAVIQEGIKTIDKIDGNICEPMIYMINGQVAANLIRANNSRDQFTSLNMAGMSFYNLQNIEENRLEIGGSKNDVAKVYAMIARLASLAATKEKY